MADTNINKQVKELEQLYLDGKYTELKEKLVKDRDSLSPGVFHYNLGTILAKEGNLAAARYNLEKAKSLGFSHPALIKNLDSVTKKVQVTQYNSEKPLDIKLLEGFVFTSDSLFLLASLLCALFMTILLRMKLIKNRYIFVALLALSTTPFLVKKYHYNTTYMTAVNIKATKVFEGPSEIYEPIKEIEGGQKVIIGKSFEDWIFVNWPVEYSGWVKRQDLGVL